MYSFLRTVSPCNHNSSEMEAHLNDFTAKQEYNELNPAIWKSIKMAHTYTNNYLKMSITSWDTLTGNKSLQN